MRSRRWLTGLLFAALALAQEKKSSDSQVLADFERRIADYLKVHRLARAREGGLKATNSPAQIAHHERELAQRIRESRSSAQGTIFTPEIALEFRRLLGITLDGTEGERIRASLRHAEPVGPHPLRVNGPYPSGVPLQSIPPSLLLNLPPVPAELEYRIVGRDLVLRDVEANLVVDFISGALP
jgi:hypothetical protein